MIQGFLSLTVTYRRGVTHVCALAYVSSLDVISGPTVKSCPSTVSRDPWLHIWLWHTVQCSLLKERWGILSPVFSGGVFFCHNTNHISANEQTGKSMRVISVEYDWGKSAQMWWVGKLWGDDLPLTDTTSWPVVGLRFLDYQKIKNILGELGSAQWL